MRDVRVDVLAERDLARKVRDAERLLSEDAKEALDLVQPRRARRRVVEVHARILREPLLHLRRAVRRRVVEHDVQFLPRMATRDMLHEAEKILGCVTPDRWSRTRPSCATVSTAGRQACGRASPTRWASTRASSRSS